MGGPGSGNTGAVRGPDGRFVRVLEALEAEPRNNLETPPNPGLSRVCLEPVMARAAVVGDDALVEAIRAELAARTWQNVNPYAVGT